MTASMWWVVAMLVTFTVGGMTGVMLSIPAVDFVVHNSSFLVAHFHNTIIGGAVFSYFAAITYWFPKATGFKLNEALGKWTCAFWFVGFFLAWMPVYLLGFDGMTRRLATLDMVEDQHWMPYLVISMIGVACILAGILTFVLNIVVSIVKRNDPAYRDLTGDPWDGRTLEWATLSPPQFYNFGRLPVIYDRDPHYDMKKRGTAYTKPDGYEPIHMPKNTWAGVFIGGFATLMGFGFIWHIWWMVILGFAGIIVSWIKYNLERDKDYYVPVEEVEKLEADYINNNAHRI